MKLKSLLTIGLLVMATACTGSLPGPEEGSSQGTVRISLSQDERTIGIATKADDPLPALDDFEVEIYNSRAIRLYRKPYSEAKSEAIKLNAGEFRLVAHHGDSLGAGFGKAYYLADQNFTVHGYVENDGKPDEVSAVASLGNVKLAVSWGENISTGYSDYYAVVRHSSYSKKSVKFTKNESRFGYIPGGDLYVEVYALTGNGEWGYYKSEPYKYDPRDFVTFNIETGQREGSLTVTIVVDKEVETVETSFEIPASALPADAPVFNHKGVSGTSFTYDYTAGLGGSVTDAILSFVSRPGLETLTLETDCPYLTWVGVPTSIELLSASSTQQKSLEDNGIRWIVEDGSPFGCVDFSGAVSNVRQGIPFDASDPVSAVFTVTAVDKAGKQSKAVFRLRAVPVQATITAEDYDIWGWKILRPVALLKDVSAPSGTDIKLQYSKDGSSWTTVDAVDINGSKVTFSDIYGLTAGTDYKFRTILNSDEGNTSDPSIIRTEDPAQVGNSGFEEYTTLTHTTPVALLSDFTVTWWQLYSGTDHWWAVNSPVTLRDGTVPAAYQDFKSYPTVALTTDGSYSGNSLIIATIFIDDYGSKILAGSNSNAGEIFIGSANDLCEGNWAKTSEGHSFPSRPATLEFQYKFTRGGSTKAFIASVEILDSKGVVIGSGSLQSSDEKSSWIKGSIPISYSVTTSKAASIKMSFRSSTDGQESVKTVFGTDVNTLSGSHEIHCGNLLYLDNIELKYE